MALELPDDLDDLFEEVSNLASGIRNSRLENLLLDDKIGDAPETDSWSFIARRLLLLFKIKFGDDLGALFDDKLNLFNMLLNIIALLVSLQGLKEDGSTDLDEILDRLKRMEGKLDELLQRRLLVMGKPNRSRDRLDLSGMCSGCRSAVSQLVAANIEPMRSDLCGAECFEIWSRAS